MQKIMKEKIDGGKRVSTVSRFYTNALSKNGIFRRNSVSFISIGLFYLKRGFHSIFTLQG